jgi:putative SOS response-associated peptidase YedK
VKEQLNDARPMAAVSRVPAHVARQMTTPVQREHEAIRARLGERIHRRQLDSPRPIKTIWGMPEPLQFGGAPITNIRNVGSPHWRGWLGKQNRCIVPATSFLRVRRYQAAQDAEMIRA